jgi:hypothetical protein
MMKKIWVLFLCLVSLSGFAASLPLNANFECPRALSTDNPGFCASFKSVATCHCTSSGLPSGMCQDMNALYNRMIVVFGTQENACRYQRHTTPTDCMDNWNCYRRGGVNSQGNSCSSTQRACQ